MASRLNKTLVGECNLTEGSTKSLATVTERAGNKTENEHSLEKLPRQLLITKWVDYSNKYGFGAQLSDGSVVVRFNDCTKIALSSDKR